MNILYSHQTQAIIPKKLNGLNSGLTLYGLRSEDWCISKIKGTTYKIKNIHEPEFCFMGHIEFINGRKRWKSLELISI